MPSVFFSIQEEKFHNFRAGLFKERINLLMIEKIIIPISPDDPKKKRKENIPSNEVIQVIILKALIIGFLIVYAKGVRISMKIIMNYSNKINSEFLGTSAFIENMVDILLSIGVDEEH